MATQQILGPYPFDAVDITPVISLEYGSICPARRNYCS